MLRLVRKETFMQGAKVAGLVGVGALGAKLGGKIARRASLTIDDFAAQSSMNACHVDAGAGLALDVAGLFVASKVTSPATAAKAAPFVIGGTLLGAYAPELAALVVTKGEELIDSIFDSVGGAREPDDIDVAPPAPAPLQKSGGVIDMPALRRPGGLHRQRLSDGGVGLAGELQRGGGLHATRGTVRPGLGGEIRRGNARSKGGGLFSGRGHGPQLGGELRR